MADTRIPGSTTRNTSGIITTHPAWLCCVIVTVETDGDYVDFYEGRDATSGHKLFGVKALASRSIPFNLTRPVYCDRGIYIAFSTTGNECSVIWSPDDGRGPVYKQV